MEGSGDTLNETLLDSLLRWDEGFRQGRHSLPAASSGQDALPDELLAAREALRELHTEIPLPLSSAALSQSGVPRQLGPFVIESVLGVGGFAVVYLARHAILKRQVALKVPRPHALLSADLRLRFLTEAQAAAQLDHPRIIPTLEAGEDQGIPYIAYVYCPGPTLAQWLDSQAAPPPPVHSAEVVLALAEAIQYSHSLGILHRDLKPGNILLFPQHEPESARFPYLAKISDFGLAKLLEAELNDTASSILMGTPRYMAPEQVERNGASVGPATDVYGLGMILHELLTGRPVIEADNPWDALAKVRDLTPPSPRQMNRQVPVDLATICLKCLSKSPASRYESARLLAEDLRRFLQGRPILGRPLALTDRIGRWCRRNPLLAGLWTTTALAVTVALIGLGAYAYTADSMSRKLQGKNAELSSAIKQLGVTAASARKAESLAEERNRIYRSIVYSTEISRAADAWHRGNVQLMSETLKPWATIAPGDTDLREFAWHYLWRQQAHSELFRTQLPAAQYFIRFLSDGTQFVSAGADSVIRIFSTDDFRLLREIQTQQQEINGLAFGPGDEWLASAGDDGTVVLIDYATGTVRSRWTVFPNAAAYQLAYSPASGCLAVCGAVPEVKLVDISTGQERGTLGGVHQTAVESISLASDGRRLLTCGRGGRFGVWDLEQQQCLFQSPEFYGHVTTGTWSRDGRYFVVGPQDLTLRVWDSTTFQELAQTKLIDPPQSLSITQEGWLLAGDRGGSINVFPRLFSGQQAPSDPILSAARWSLHQDRLYGLDVSPDGKRFVSAAKNGQVAAFETNIPEPFNDSQAPEVNADLPHRFVVGPDQFGRTFRRTAQGVAVWEGPPTSAPRLLLPARDLSALTWNDDILLACDDSGKLYRWSTHDKLGDPQIAEPFPGKGLQKIVPFDQDRCFLVGSHREVMLWNHRLQLVERTQPTWHNVAVSPDRQWIAAAETSTHVLLLVNAADFSEAKRWTGHTEAVHVLTFNRDGRQLISGSDDRTIRFLQTSTFQEVMCLRGHEERIRLIALTSDGRTLAASDRSGSVRLWDLHTGRQLCEMLPFAGNASELQFGPDDQELRILAESYLERCCIAAPFQPASR